MTLQNFQYDTIMREYSRRESENRFALEKRREEVYKKLPRLQEIDEEVASLSARKIKSLLQKNSSDYKDLYLALEQLSEERMVLLISNGYPIDYLEHVYTCPHCHDTGYINGQKCTCFKKAEIALLFKQSNLNEIIKKENFEHFSFEYYSDTIKDEITGRSALEAAKFAFQKAHDFIQKFPSESPNLFLYGNTGVGKTFLSHCIANELLESTYSVLYFSAFDLFDMRAKSTFSKDSEKDFHEDLIFDCDLLIIDDLGTELTNSFVSSQLFLCINERINSSKSTIISTNLTIEEFSNTYSERTFSRIAQHYQLVKLVGKDIRIQKLLPGGK